MFRAVAWKRSEVHFSVWFRARAPAFNSRKSGKIVLVWAFRVGWAGFSSRDVNTFDRHLLREWLQILGLVLAATCGLLLINVLYDDFRDLRELGARGWALLE